MKKLFASVVLLAMLLCGCHRNAAPAATYTPDKSAPSGDTVAAEVQTAYQTEPTEGEAETQNAESEPPTEDVTKAQTDVQTESGATNPTEVPNEAPAKVPSETQAKVPGESTVKAEPSKAPQSETAPAEADTPKSVVVPILMFHDIKKIPGGTWSMADYNFRNTMEFILDEGYTPVTFRQLVAFVDGCGELPEKPVCITLDDGYYSTNELVLPIITELKIPVTVFMTCGTVRDADEIIGTDPNMLYKMNARELAETEGSPYVDVQSHSFALHGENTAYGEGKRDNVMPLPGESEAQYRAIFNEDCERAEAVLRAAGVQTAVVFSYPCGMYNPFAEEILRERCYRASVTVDTGKRNLVVQGDRESLFLLGRLNVNDDTSREELKEFLERK